ncbi:hypothetical protein VNO77_04421 [Canavalia gladiata]|uniref:Uncharacterized protein n=1 Tax=Canavalia gladiata TaxID=3824 RepID=A0AAN9MXB1_CANGL
MGHFCSQRLAQNAYMGPVLLSRKIQNRFLQTFTALQGFSATSFLYSIKAEPARLTKVTLMLTSPFFEQPREQAMDVSVIEFGHSSPLSYTLHDVKMTHATVTLWTQIWNETIFSSFRHLIHGSELALIKLFASLLKCSYSSHPCNSWSYVSQLLKELLKETIFPATK